MIELNRNIWYVRLFFWSLGIYGAFLDNYQYGSPYYMEMHGTNLCFFIRVIVVYMPLILLLHAAFVVVAVASLTALPIYLFGGITYGWIVVVIAAVILFIAGVKKLMLKRRVRRMQVKFIEQPKAAARALKEPSFLKVLGVYCVATKKRICPSIAFLMSEEVR